MTRWLAAFAAFSLVLLPSPSSSASVPFSKKTVSLAARGQPVGEFLIDLFAQAGLRAKVSTAVKGKVNGVFTGTPDVLWEQLARAYSLVLFYDGTARIYHSSEVASRSIASADPGGVLRDANGARLVGGVNTLQVGSGVVLASGVPAFLDRVEQLAAARMAKPAVTAPPATVAGGMTPVPFTGPLSPMPDRAPVARGMVKSEVRVPAGKRSPYEIRIFYLKYIQPTDRIVDGPGGGVVVPGAVTMLTNLMGDQLGGVSQTGGANRVEADQRVTLSSRAARATDAIGVGGRDRGEGTNDAPESVLMSLDGPRIVADPSNKAVLIKDRPEVMDSYEATIAGIDIEPPRVETTVTILELNTEKLKDLGVDFDISIGGVRALFGGALGAGDLAGGYIRGGRDQYFARVRALEAKGVLRQTFTTNLTGRSNQELQFTNLRTATVPLVGERVADAQIIEYGMQILVTPSVIEDGGTLRVQLDLKLADTQLVGNTADGIPIVGGPTISTQIVIPHGESALITGMSNTIEFDNKTKVPILGDIPVLGQVFRGRNKGTVKTEKLVLITPRIVSTQSADVAPEEYLAPVSLEPAVARAPAPRRRRK